MPKEPLQIQSLSNNNDMGSLDTTVYVGMSGGVDSSVVAALLVERGYKVIGVYLDCWDYEEIGCHSNDDRSDALKVATKLGIKLLTWDFRKEYKDKVLLHFLDSYKKGITPNPDILCNAFIKFGSFAEHVFKIDSSAFIATGHYAKNFLINNNVSLIGKGRDLKKDQSYFLYDIDRNILKNVLFPLGNWKKDEVRIYAKKHGLVVSKKPDSQGVCFTGGLNVKEYLIDNIGYKKGNVINSMGEIVGNHLGCYLYTIGEKYSDAIVLNNNFEKLYVIDKNIDENILYVGGFNNSKKDIFSVLMSSNYIYMKDYILNLAKRDELFVQIRNTGSLHRCKVEFKKDGLCFLKLEKMINGVSAGQSAVFYQKVEMEWLIVAGGVISSA